MAIAAALCREIVRTLPLRWVDLLASDVKRYSPRAGAL
jgi:hypothetical protein